MTRVMVLGGTGMLGHKLVHVLATHPSLEVHATVRTPPPPDFRPPRVRYHEGVNLNGGTARLARALEQAEPQVVVNAIGAIKQKDLHSDVDQTFFLNGALPHILPFLGGAGNAKLIHVSTDCVFTGDRGGYTEAEAPDATDVYGCSKAVGEIRRPPHLTIRTSIIGFEIGGGQSLLSWLFGHPRGARVPGYARALFSGLPTVTLSRVIRDLILDPRELTGLYHVASEPISKLELLERINRAFDLGYTIVPDDRLRIDRSLDDSRFREKTGTTRPGWHELIGDLQQDRASLPYDMTAVTADSHGRA